MTRKEAIKNIVKAVKKGDIIVSSTGMTSRELYNIKDRPLNFYIMASMGNTLAVGLGMALDTSKKVIAIIGDGEALMGLGSFITLNKLKPNNLIVYVLNNQEHASTGGQITSSLYCRFQSLAPFNVINVPIDKGKGNALRIPLSCKTIKERFMRALNE